MKAGWHYILQEDGFGTTRTVYDTMNREVEVTTESTGGEEECAEISYYKNGARHKITYADGSTEEDSVNSFSQISSRMLDGRSWCYEILY